MELNGCRLTQSEIMIEVMCEFVLLVCIDTTVDMSCSLYIKLKTFELNF